ncbi:NAD(P)-dependent alcohol dehydrogenase [Comamonadaceae bacterium G21597-S1]|nr:NAD(P)-dependent alcohol dehydrogenase [Comamonadaceae bacterium G21597-S1]
MDKALPSAGPGEVVVALRATTINNHDLINLAGGYRGLPLPRIPFSDGCGEVVDVGNAVSGLRRGDRVIVQFFPNWQAGPPTAAALSTVRGDHVEGCLQTHLRARADAVFKAPDHLSDAEAAALGCSGLTAWRSLVVEGCLKPGQVVVVQGSGGVSTCAISIAHALGARVIATSSSNDKLLQARALGADATVNYREQPDWAKAVLKLTEGRGADHIIEVGGPDTFAQSLRALSLGGHLSVIGALTGTHGTDLSPRAIMAKNATVKGITVGSREHLQDFCRMVASTGMRPRIARSFVWTDADAALACMREQRHFGKLALAITD